MRYVSIEIEIFESRPRFVWIPYTLSDDRNGHVYKYIPRVSDVIYVILENFHANIPKLFHSEP